MSRHLASRPALPALTILALLLGLALTAVRPTAVAAGTEPTELIADLNGANEVPGPGDDDGVGFASLTFEPGAGQVCAFLSVLDIAAATMAHVHVGTSGVAGGIVITLPTPDAEGFAEDCVTGLDSTLLQSILDDPAGFYVNVHNGEFPDGAIRGQLEVPPPPPVELFAGLSGAAEVPGPGDPDGSGQAFLAVFLESGELCVDLFVEEIAQATMAHIHVGAVGVAGSIVVTLPTPDADGFASECIAGLDPTLLDGIVAAPSGYYVNVHNGEFPDGAIRGQLSTEPPPPPQCGPPELCEGELPPGTYTYHGFGTDLTLTTTTWWFSQLFDDIPAFALLDSKLGGGVFGFRFSGEVFADPCDFGSASTIGSSAADVIAWLADRPFLTTSDPIAVEYGGEPGFQVDVSAVTLPADCDDPPWVLLFPLPVVGDFHFEASSVARVVAQDVNGETILFIAESFGGLPEVFLPQAQGVLDSIVWSTGAEGGGGPPPTATPTIPDTALPAPGIRVEVLLGMAALGVAAILAGRRRPAAIRR